MVAELAVAGATVGSADGRAADTMAGAAGDGLHASSRLEPASAVADAARLCKKVRRLRRSRLPPLLAERLRGRVDSDIVSLLG
jgi:hypothetical protein